MDILLSILVYLVLIGLFWILPIWLGLRAARKKNRSGHWMWFGCHPIGGWITFAVLVSLPPLRICPQCGEKSKSHAKICPYCMSKFDELYHLIETQAVECEPSHSTKNISMLTSIIVAKIVVSIICFVMPLLYILVFCSSVLHGNISKFAIGFSKIPFKQTPIIVLIVISILTFVAINGIKFIFYAKITPKPSYVIPMNLAFAIVASGFMETIGIYGLVIGFMYGSDVASLTLIMLFVTIIGGVIIFPRKHAWQTMHETSLNLAAK